MKRTAARPQIKVSNKQAQLSGVGKEKASECNRDGRLLNGWTLVSKVFV